MFFLRQSSNFKAKLQSKASLRCCRVGLPQLTLTSPGLSGVSSAKLVSNIPQQRACSLELVPILRVLQHWWDDTGLRSYPASCRPILCQMHGSNFLGKCPSRQMGWTSLHGCE